MKKVSVSPYTFPFTPYELILFGMCCIGLIFAILLGFSPNRNRKANRLLALALLTMIWWMVRVLPFGNHLSWQFLLATGPLLYLYVRQITRPAYRLNGRHLLHFVPVLLEQWLAHQAALILPLLIFISVITYLYYAHRLIRDFYRRLQPVLMDRSLLEFRWLRRLLAATALLWLLWISSAAYSGLAGQAIAGRYTDYPVCLLFGVILCWTAMAAFLTPQAGLPEPVVKPKTGASAELRSKSAWLKQKMKTGRYYLDPELNLASLAAKLGLTTHELSRIINGAFKKSLSEFINDYRVREVMSRINDPDYDHLTLLGIAYESGFNSQATFSRIFRQVTGQNAAAYKNELKKQRSSYNLSSQAGLRPVVLPQQTTVKWLAEKNNRHFMFRNYLKTAWRNILTKKSTSFINISGLAVGMAVALLIGLWIREELSFNTYHQNYDRIARVMQSKTTNGVINTSENVPIPLASELRTTYGGNFKYVVLSSGVWNHILNSPDKQLLKTGSFMQPEAPELLGLHMIRGNRAGLGDPAAVLLSAATAKALYGDTDPTGKILKLDNKLPAKVSGVYDDLPQSSSFSDLAFIASWQLYYAADESLRKAAADWGNNAYLLYVQLNEHADVNSVSAQIKDAKLKQVDQGSAKFKPAISLQAMSRWHLYAEYRNGVNTGGEITYVWLFGLIGVFVLLLACINFMNLSTARSEKRAREVGVRKAIGSLRGQLILQFFTESVAVALLSFLFAVVLAWLALPFFNEVAGKNMGMPWANVLFWLICLSFSILAGLLAGVYPALYLSSFNPVSVLKGTFKAGRYSALPRQVLVVVQFAVSVILIIGTIVTFKQVQYAQNRAVGYNRAGLITMEINSGTIHREFSAFRNELIGSGAVVDVAESGSSTTGIFGGAGGLKWAGKDPQLNDEFGMVGIGTSYGRTVGWQISQGRDLSSAFAADSGSVMLNEAAVTYMNLKHPVGETIDWWGKKYQVVGVVKNMVMASPYEPAKQTIFFMEPKAGNFLLIRINPQLSAKAALAKIQTIWKAYSPEEPMDFHFTDQEYQKKFTSEQTIGTLAGVFSALAVFISCMGLFGMAIFVAEQRIKEIGVRKILGASTFHLWRMLSLNFVSLVGISLLIAFPVAWLLMHNWLGRYAYHTGLSWWVFVFTGIGAIALTLMTVSYHTLKAAITSPVKSLKAD